MIDSAGDVSHRKKRSRLLMGVIAALSIGVAGCDSPSSTCSPTVMVDGGNEQTGTPGMTLSQPLQILALDCSGGSEVGAVGYMVAWEARDGLVNGSPAETTVTDANGRSQVSWTLANSGGTQSVGVSVFYPRTGMHQGVDFRATAVPTCGPAPVIHGVPGTGTLVTSDETWGPGDHRIVGSLRYSGRIQLRILAGARVCVDGFGIELGLDDSSSVQILGTAAAPVRILPLSTGDLRIENYSNRPVDSSIRSRIVNALLDGVTIEGYAYDVDSTYMNGGRLVLDGGSTVLRSTLSTVDVTLIARDGTTGEFEASFLYSSPGMRVMGLGGELWFHGCEFVAGPIDIESFAAGIRFEQSNFQNLSMTSLDRADSVQAGNNYWYHSSGPNPPNPFGAVNVHGPIRTRPFLMSAAPIGYRPQF